MEKLISTWGQAFFCTWGNRSAVKRVKFINLVMIQSTAFTRNYSMHMINYQGTI